MPRLVVLLAGAFCLSCSSPIPTAQNPEAAQEEVAPWETVSINGATYRRVAAKPTEAQETVLISILIPVEVSSDGTLTFSDIVMIGDRVYTADCATSSSSSTSSDDVGNTRATATNLTAMPAESSTKWTFFKSKPYQLTRGDVDYFRVRLNQRADLGIMSDSPDRSNPVDTAGKLMDSSGRLLAQNNDATQDPPHFVMALAGTPAGTYYVEVKGGTSSAAGTYELWTATRIPKAGKPVAELDGQQIQIERLARF